MYTAIASRWPEIVCVFSFASTSSIVNQALNSLIKLAELVRSDLNEFETLLNKESLKTTVAGAGSTTGEICNARNILRRIILQQFSIAVGIRPVSLARHQRFICKQGWLQISIDCFSEELMYFEALNLFSSPCSEYVFNHFL
ncbi:hypothetical protein L1887_30156 [Cichorium endivia]|nr:hypothetical protein L1887_30156 [Cichorium endivia]